MTALASAPRYSADDFDTASIRSAAPSYVSEVPSYRSRTTYNEASPAYTPRATTTTTTNTATTITVAGPSQRIFSGASSSLTGRPTVGLPPLPPLASPRVLNEHNFRIPTWSAGNAPAARHYRNVAERRAIDGRLLAAADLIGMRDTTSTINRQNESNEDPVVRPLEDPYLVGEEAAAEARQRRIAREVGEEMLREEDKQWDWMLAQMKRQERDRNWTRMRQEAVNSRRKTLLRRIGGRLL
ncbi:hypothetical protein H0G86_007806 [Trichoderma simmonsii]|uniref:Uncharacterized protein n=1 Tax=Trichoderma simmonsii TaxID=1491479 RepID=A0A8G0PLB6_9HYPO|nr:hypothetical protein Trihar35433_3678 [Trichoderma harzianum]QYT00729.1 hypothetical protein H0G86_007806 [Trichoderma simmonsii]